MTDLAIGRAAAIQTASFRLSEQVALCAGPLMEDLAKACQVYQGDQEDYVDFDSLLTMLRARIQDITGGCALIHSLAYMEQQACVDGKRNSVAQEAGK